MNNISPTKQLIDACIKNNLHDVIKCHKKYGKLIDISHCNNYILRMSSRLSSIDILKYLLDNFKDEMMNNSSSNEFIKNVCRRKDFELIKYFIDNLGDKFDFDYDIKKCRYVDSLLILSCKILKSDEIFYVLDFYGRNSKDIFYLFCTSIEHKNLYALKYVTHNYKSELMMQIKDFDYLSRIVLELCRKKLEENVKIFEYLLNEYKFLLQKLIDENKIDYYYYPSYCENVFIDTDPYYIELMLNSLNNLVLNPYYRYDRIQNIDKLLYLQERFGKGLFYVGDNFIALNIYNIEGFYGTKFSCDNNNCNIMSNGTIINNIIIKCFKRNIIFVKANDDLYIECYNIYKNVMTKKSAMK